MQLHPDPPWTGASTTTSLQGGPDEQRAQELHLTAGQLPAHEIPEAWQRIIEVPVTLDRIQDAPAVIAITQQLERKSAYDAAYIALAQQFETELWTLDGKLARNAASRGLPVKLIETF